MAQPSSPIRERLICAAIDILGSDGGAAMTVRRVAQEAGCSTIGVYTHFDGKAGLLDEVVRDGYEAFDAAVAVGDGIEDGLERMRAGGRAYRRWALSNPTRYRVMFASLVPDFTPGPATLARGDASFAAHRARVDYCVSRGDIVDADPDVIAHHLWATLHGHSMLHILMEIPLVDAEAERSFEQALEWLLAGLRPDA